MRGRGELPTPSSSALAPNTLLIPFPGHPLTEDPGRPTQKREGNYVCWLWAAPPSWMMGGWQGTHACRRSEHSQYRQDEGRSAFHSTYARQHSVCFEVQTHTAGCRIRTHTVTTCSPPRIGRALGLIEAPQ